MSAAGAFSPPKWHLEDGQVVRTRHAEHWRRNGSQVACGLCYRKCVLDDGETGWCGFRSARGGRMELDSHGVITSLVQQVRGYGPDPFITYKPGMTSVFLGGIQCTAGCTFCMSAQIVHKPEAVPWGGGKPEMVPSDSLLYARRALMHPADAVAAARHRNASSVLFGINEPTLSFEWTADVARLARRHGLDVLIETNGFTEPVPLRQLAKLTDAVDVGTKGSLDDTFYERVMRSPGGAAAVRRALLEWRRAGVHLVVGDLVAPPHMQDDKTFRSAAERFYGWLADRLGPLTDVLVTQIFRPGPVGADGTKAGRLTRDPGEDERYGLRVLEAVEMARDAGLPYAHAKDTEPVRCHACGGVLLAFTQWCGTGEVRAGLPAAAGCAASRYCCPWWAHEQHVTADSRCGHCGTQVPVVVLSESELERERAKVTADAGA